MAVSGKCRFEAFPLFLLLHLLCKSKVNQHQAATIVEQQIVWFQIPMDNVQIVTFGLRHRCGGMLRRVMIANVVCLRFWSGRKCHLCNTNLLFFLYFQSRVPTSRTCKPGPRWHMQHSRWRRLPSVGPLTWSDQTGCHPDRHPLESRRTWRLWMFWKAEK